MVLFMGSGSVLYKRNLAQIILPSSIDGKGHLRKAGDADSTVAKTAQLDADLPCCSYWAQSNVHLRH
jgi:hypothetical protein